MTIFLFCILPMMISILTWFFMRFFRKYCKASAVALCFVAVFVGIISYFYVYVFYLDGGNAPLVHLATTWLQYAGYIVGIVTFIIESVTEELLEKD